MGVQTSHNTSAECINHGPLLKNRFSWNFSQGTLWGCFFNFTC